ncbi:MAG TPA: hypothetical protein VJN69_05370 [Candidatus Acidoferrales bacterium]|nr:hypothetical protein [Candidatus Acidoferrales bacterium]
MNFKLRQPLMFAALLICILWLTPGHLAGAQDSQVLLPEQSAAKAKQIMQQAIDALGGKAFLDVRDVTCTGNLSQFDHAGQLSGFEKFIDYSMPPSKDRTENLPKRNEIDIFNGDEGWNLDRGGVSPEPAALVAQHKDDVAKSLNNILRNRINEPDMDISYAGPDIVDLKQVDWVRLMDPQDRTIRIAFDRMTHLPVQKIVESRDPRLHANTTEVEYYSLYYDADGVKTPKQIARERNNMKIYQVFFDKCQYNTGLQDSLFAKQSLDERWEKLPNKYRDKKKKKDESPKNN